MTSPRGSLRSHHHHHHHHHNAIEIQDDGDDPNAARTAEDAMADDGNGSNDSNSSSMPEPITREQKLTMKQLERFRKAMSKKGRRGSGNGRSWSAKKRNDSVEFDNLFYESTAAAREIRIVTYPWPTWIFGALLIVATTIYIHQVHQRALEVRRGGKDDENWWKYLVGIVVYLLSLALIANGRVETFHMSKDHGRLLIRSTKPFCMISKLRRERNIDRDLKHIRDVRVEASGEFSGDIDTRAYKVHFDFDDGTHANALEARSKTKATRRCRLIKTFLLSLATGSSVSRANGPEPEEEVQVNVESTE